MDLLKRYEIMKLNKKQSFHNCYVIIRWTINLINNKQIIELIYRFKLKLPFFKAKRYGECEDLSAAIQDFFTNKNALYIV